MDRLAALPEELQCALWKGWVCDVVRRAYGARPSPRHPLCIPLLFREVAHLAEALWSASYGLSPPKDDLLWFLLDLEGLKGMHPSASQTSSVLQWLDLNVENLPSERVRRRPLRDWPL